MLVLPVPPTAIWASHWIVLMPGVPALQSF